jgi:hypothetical protein
LSWPVGVAQPARKHEVAKSDHKSIFLVILSPERRWTMGDHRISLKVEFEMHGHKAKIDQWVNWSPDYADKIRDWLEQQIEIGRGKWFDAEYDAQLLRDAEREAAERDELARLKAKYESSA